MTTEYVVHNVMFKFAMDEYGIYGGKNNDASAKAAGHELKGLLSYFNCNIPGINHHLYSKLKL